MTQTDNPPASSALAEIERERQRQIEVEGWSPRHDDGHADGSLLKAAICYYLNAQDAALYAEGAPAPAGWPWAPAWWKPKDRRRDLVRAGALCLAERERLRRISPAIDVEHADHWLRLVLDRLHGLPPAAA